MNEGRDGKRCYFHPREVVVGVCALCLSERLLLLLASKQETHTNYTSKPKMALPTKIIALTNLLNLSDTKHKSEVLDSTSSASQEESFISIKFEENGVASWEKGKISKASHDQQCKVSCHESSDKSKKIKRVCHLFHLIKSKMIEHPKSRRMMRWRRQIGHLFHLIKRKRPNKGNVCQVSTKLEGAKVKYGWIRILTKRTKV